MTERTERDDLIDQAIELLIDDKTEGFLLVTLEQEDVHLAQETYSIDDSLLAIHLIAEDLNLRLEECGNDPMSPLDIMAAAYSEAIHRGLTQSNYTDFKNEQ